MTDSKRDILILNEDSVKLSFDVIDELPLSERSKSMVKTVGLQFNQFLQDQGLKLGSESIKQFFEFGIGKARAATRNSKKYALKKLIENQPFFTNSIAAKAMLDRLFKQIQRYQVNDKVEEGDYLTEQEVEKIYKHCLCGKARKIKVGLLTMALFQTGCRISELLKIEKRDCRVGEYVSISISGKGRKERTVFMKSELYNKIITFFEGEDFIFQGERGNQIFRNNFYRSLANIARQAGVEKRVHPHALRHGCAMHLLKQKKMSVKAVSEYLGHSDIAVTLKYYIHEMPSAADVLG